MIAFILCAAGTFVDAQLTDYCCFWYHLMLLIKPVLFQGSRSEVTDVDRVKAKRDAEVYKSSYFVSQFILSPTSIVIPAWLNKCPPKRLQT